jgi:hypothetical protein
MHISKILLTKSYLVKQSGKNSSLFKLLTSSLHMPYSEESASYQKKPSETLFGEERPQRRSRDGGDGGFSRGRSGGRFRDREQG